MKTLREASMMVIKHRISTEVKSFMVINQFGWDEEDFDDLVERICNLVDKYIEIRKEIDA
jgi:sugar (pentulose or hexulose) kinase